MKFIEKLARKQNDLYGEPPATLAFLGDSVTQGCLDDFRSGRACDSYFENKIAYSTRVNEILHMMFPKSQINVVNCGIAGDNARGGLARLDRDILPHHPDLVVVSYGLNDANNGIDALDKYTDALDGIFKRVTEAGAECIFMTENTMNTHVSCHIKEEMFLQIAASTAKVQNEGILDRYFEAGKEVAKRNGVRICDCYAKWKAMMAAGVNTTELLVNRTNHPIPEMHYLFAYSLIETMLDIGK